jgi:CRISPR-associated protein Csb3
MSSINVVRVRVSPLNPGEFLACCGLLELADRLSGNAEAWFEAGAFVLRTRGSLSAILDALLAKQAAELTTLDNGLEVKPLIAPLRLDIAGRALVLDAWMSIRVDKGEVVAAANPPWNFWSGQQTSLRIWTSLRQALMDQRAQLAAAGDEALFAQRVPLSGRFGFDPGAAWNALDVGFSPNEHRIEVASSPAVELLAAVGLQRFRPDVSKDRSSFVYGAWRSPLGVQAAALAACGRFDFGSIDLYRGVVVSRGSYAALGHSSRHERTSP